MTLSSFMEAQDLKRHRWKDRVILISADEDHLPTMQTQLDTLLQHQAGLDSRKLVIYACNTLTCDFYGNGKRVDSFTKSEKNAGFRLQLIGLDGGVKFTSKKVVSSTELFQIIDAMPMRMQELKRKKNGNE